jgi:hypothetical protein
MRAVRTTHGTNGEAKAGMFGDIERFYHPKRRRSTIGYSSPVESEMRLDFLKRGVSRTGCRADVTYDLFS